MAILRSWARWNHHTKQCQSGLPAPMLAPQNHYWRNASHNCRQKWITSSAIVQIHRKSWRMNLRSWIRSEMKCYQLWRIMLKNFSSIHENWKFAARGNAIITLRANSLASKEATSAARKKRFDRMGNLFRSKDHQHKANTRIEAAQRHQTAQWHSLFS